MKFTTLLAAASLGIISLGAAACGDDGATAETPASPAASGSATSAPPTSSSPGAASPKVSGSQVIMIDPSGKKYTRTETVKLAVGMAAAFKQSGVPSGFCAQSYQQGVDGGGKFPAGKLAFIEACEEGMRQAR